jgi:hypothetical protein
MILITKLLTQTKYNSFYIIDVTHWHGAFFFMKQGHSLFLLYIFLIFLFFFVVNISFYKILICVSPYRIEIGYNLCQSIWFSENTFILFFGQKYPLLSFSWIVNTFILPNSRQMSFYPNIFFLLSLHVLKDLI